MSNEIPQGTPYAPAPPNSSMAIVSLVAGILGLTFFPFLGSIAAVITGYMARKEIEQSMGALSGAGLATAGLVLGWIGIGLGVLGLCVGGAFIVIPLCLATFAIFNQGSSLILPVLVALL
jgi:hypothetical protein